MCGIFGVWGHDRAAELTHLGLYSLQHRGQESAGIVGVGADGVARSVRRMGLVSEGFTPDDVARVTGPVAIGHTRYSTAGTSTLDNAQPVLARFRDGHLALAHNGNLVNAIELRRDLEDRGSIFSSSMDSEVIVHRMARSSAVKPEHQLADALSKVDGAYSLLVLNGDTLLAARDPRGWRPLSIGRLGDAWVFSSETCGLDIVEATLVREVKPGEIVAIDRDGFRSLQAFPPASPLRRCVFEHV
jgi:amidophosphoribosyltransferase